MKKSIILIPTLCLLLAACNDDTVYEDRIKSLQDEITYLQGSNNNMLEKMTQLSVINKEDASSISASLEIMNEQQSYITTLTDKIHQKDSINFALVTNLKKSLLDVNDEDVQIEVKGSAVYVSLSDNLLFTTASAKVNKEAYTVLEKVARIINDQAEIQVLVQGHTDNVPIDNKHFKDNWDLSTSRALAVVRILENRFVVHPTILTASGKGEYEPKGDNATIQGRKMNRRTEIILKPALGQFFELLTVPDLYATET